MKVPEEAVAVLRLDRLILRDQLPLSERMSSRMVKCASVVGPSEFLGWQMTVPRDDAAQMEVFGSAGIGQDDLAWAVEKMARTAPAEASGDLALPGEVMELFLPMGASGGLGFGASGRAEAPASWPMGFPSGLGELVRALRTTGAAFRAVVGPATAQEQDACRREVLRTWPGGGVPVEDYLGRPVKLRALLRLPAAPSARLRAILEETVPGVRLRQAPPGVWDHPLDGAPTLPDYAARILMLEPRVVEATVGLEVCQEEPKPIPASHRNPGAEGAVTIGRAVETSGRVRDITVGPLDLRRHYQIVGQTGTGKSTLLAGMILSAIAKGHGLTFFDPHGSTIDAVLRSLPGEYARRVRVVRLGNADSPVPLGIWESDDPVKEERTISDLCELFTDLFDPNHEGIVGPRWERWFSTFAKAAIALLGRRASFEAIGVLSQSQGNMLKVYKALGDAWPELSETIKEEFGKDRSSDFQATLAWFLAKFQRVTSVEQLRRTLGAGCNALDFANAIDTDAVTLIDLASPTLGTQAARIAGTLQLMKLWNAAMARRDRDRTHLVFVDEASLFQATPTLARMLAESRKFGLAMVLCHQHLGQMNPEIREALEANSANFSAFRLSPRDAVSAQCRLGDGDIDLARLDAFRAVTTLSVDGRQTAPFTLQIDRLTAQADGERIARGIEARSVETLVRPWQESRALTAREIQRRLDELEEHPLRAKNAPSAGDGAGEVQPEWLERWKRRQAG